MNRRTFLGYTVKGSMAGWMMSSPLSLLAGTEEDTHLVILHTNDQHSRIDPFPMDGGKYQGLGGFAKRASLIASIRAMHKHVLLLDSGDIWQGTPYFNQYEGKLEYQLMSEMRYDASTLGNHDFDNGIPGLIKMLPHAGFPFLNCNYGLEGTGLEEKVSAYRIFEFGKIRVGVTGVGIDFNGLVPPALCQKVIYRDPVKKVNETASYLKRKMDCDLVIVLSHLGYEYKEPKASDVLLAKHTEDVDIILGGHTHTFLDKPVVINNLKEQKVIVNQVGWAGLLLGRIDLFFDYQKRRKNRLSAPEKII